MLSSGTDLRLYKFEFLCSRFPVMCFTVISLVHHDGPAWLILLRSSHTEILLHALTVVLAIVLQSEIMKSVAQSHMASKPLEPAFPSRSS